MLGPHPPATGGVSSHIFDLSRTLADNGNNVTVFCEANSNIATQKYDYQRYLKKRYKIIYNDVRAFSLPHLLFELNQLVEDSDIVHAHTYKTSFVVNILKKINAKKVVTTLHSYLVYEKMGANKGGIKAKLLKFVEHSVIMGSDTLISVDSRIAKWISKVYNRKVDLILKNSLYLNDYAQYKNQKKELIITCPRQLRPKNGVNIAIQAMKDLKGKRDVSLHVIGEGSERPFLEKLVRKLALSNVILHGSESREETVSIIAKSKVVVIPSIPINGLEEATSIAALEAMAVGTPVIASNIGGLKEIISHKYTGYLVKPNNPLDLAKAIEELLLDNELYETIKRNSQKYVRENHDWSKNRVFIENLYERLLHT